MSQHSYTTSLYLSIDGAECERDVTITYEFSPAGGDGWHEPRYDAGATLWSVETVMKNGNTLDMLPILSDAMREELESRCVQHELDEREFRKSEAADARREWLRECAGS